MHRVTRRYIARREGDDVVLYEEGDTFEATDAELRAFGDRLEEVESPETESAASDAESGSGEDESPSADGETDSASAESESAESDEDSESEVDATLREHGLDPDDYHELQQAAGDYDDVQGNQPTDDLKQDLADALE